jgi:hypothetical protein
MKAQRFKTAAAAVGLLLGAAKGAEAVDMGSPWGPPSAAQRFPTSIWLNEIHATGNDAARTIEVAAVTAAGIDYSLIDALLVDLAGNRVGTKNLGSDGCTITRNVGANPAVDFIVCANWQAPGSLLLGGGLALINNRGTASLTDDLPITFIFTSRGGDDQAPVLPGGLAASTFPLDQWQHALTPDGFSIQVSRFCVRLFQAVVRSRLLSIALVLFLLADGEHCNVRSRIESDRSLHVQLARNAAGHVWWRERWAEPVG